MEPLRVVIDAYSEMCQAELERNMAAAEVTNQAINVWIAAKGGKQSIDINPYKAVIKRQEAKEWISPKVAKRFIDLSTRGKVPPWVIGILEEDLEKIKLAGE